MEKIEKMKMETADGVEQNIEKIKALFPNCVTETIGDDGVPRSAINFDTLRQMLSDELIDGNEAYDFTWVGKRASMIEAHRPIRKTLRPCKEESVDWDTTQNLYIEGDNLEVLKLLQESYLHKVKMIYIDPPYNTGNDFIYRDKFAMSVNEYNEESGAVNEQGERMFKNSNTNGRFHSDWCSMIYPRLLLARNLLSDDGVVFISIDDNEVHNLRKICDEVFGSQNFVAQLIWERAYAPKNDARFISNSHDYVLFYAKNLSHFVIGRLPRTDEANSRYSNPDNDPRGVWKASDISVKTYNAACDYPIATPTGRIVEPPAGRCWSFSKNAFLERIQDNRIWFGPNGDSVPALKRFLSELKHDGMAPTSIMFFKEVGHSQEGAKEVAGLMEGGYFSGPKPVRLLRRLITLANTQSDDIVLDFFSGSATTAHAVMQLNAEHGGNRKFIMVQLPEPCDEKSEAYKAGYKNICEIGKERIRRAGKLIKESEAGNVKREKEAPRKSSLFEQSDSTSALHDSRSAFNALDVGFRVFKLDDSNMMDVYYSADLYKQGKLSHLETNIKDDRNNLDLLFGCLLDWGLPLSMPYRSEQLDGCTVHTYNDGDLIACFDANISTFVIETIARRRPLRAIFRDSGFADSPAMLNISEIFKLLSRNTEVKVL